MNSLIWVIYLVRYYQNKYRIYRGYCVIENFKLCLKFWTEDEEANIIKDLEDVINDSTNKMAFNDLTNQSLMM